jgi:uncharacterized membrane protein HdeD (DUF308 family)
MSTTTASHQTSGSAPRAADANHMNAILERSWWLIALRGLAGVLFGLVALVLPFATILALVLLFSAYMLVDGLFSIVAAVWAAQQGERWGLLTLQGLVSIATGIIAFVWPELTVVAFVLLLAAWAIVSGSLLVAVAAGVDGDHGRWWVALAGIASLAFGALMVVAPMVGAVVLTWWLGAFALVLGVALLILAFRLRSQFRNHPPVAAARSVT